MEATKQMNAYSYVFLSIWKDKNKYKNRRWAPSSNLSQPEVPGGRSEINIGPALHHARPERRERERESLFLSLSISLLMLLSLLWQDQTSRIDRAWRDGIEKKKKKKKRRKRRRENADPHGNTSWLSLSFSLYVYGSGSYLKVRRWM